MARSYQQYMSQGGAQDRFGLLDLFPALGQWVQGNRDALMAPYRENAQQQAQGLLGAPAASAMQTDAQGLTSGMTTQGSGLMQDPNDYMKQMQYSLGLMGTPGYEQAGLQMQGQALQHQMGQGARDQVQANWQAQQAQMQANRGSLTQNEYLTQSTGMATDAKAILQPLRDSVMLYSNINNVVKDKGFHGMTLTDDTVMTKTLAKLMLPNEAVMEGDIIALQTMEGLDPIIRSLAGKIGTGKALNVTERQQLYDQIQRLGAQNLQEFNQTRQDFEGRAQRAQFDPRDVLRSAPNVNNTDYRQPSGPTADMSTGVLASDANTGGIIDW